jgi:hypothetical protein
MFGAPYLLPLHQSFAAGSLAQAVPLPSTLTRRRGRFHLQHTHLLSLPMAPLFARVKAIADFPDGHLFC